MRRLPQTSLLLTLILISAAATAQTQTPPPEDGPPWWGVQDNDTVSLFWNFDNGGGALPPPTPDFEVAAPWYVNPSPWSSSGAPLQFLPQFQGRPGVYALVGNGTQLAASLSLFVANEARLDWVKQFYLQYQEFDLSGDGLSSTIRQQLAKYGRASVTERRTPGLSPGWQTVTLTGTLIPQPDDEEVDWSFSESGSDTIAIDNVYVSTRCVKAYDEVGESLGKVTSGNNSPIDLGAVTGGRTCRSAAVTDPQSGTSTRRRWISAAGGPGAPHELLELDAAGQSVINAVPLLTSPQAAPSGPMDMTVRRQATLTGPIEWVHVLLATANGTLVIEALNVQTNAIDPAQQVLIPPSVVPFAPNQRLGLTYDPDGVSFWITGPTASPLQTWRAFEFPATATSQGSVADIPVPSNTLGIAYDYTVGNFYSFSRNLVARPNGGFSRVNGAEISAYTGTQTGVKFCGDLTIPNTTGPEGGLATGMSMYRRFNGASSEARFVCVVTVGGEQFLYELAGPYRYGYSRFGTMGMASGPPFLGGSFDVTLTGVPNSLLAALFVGNDDRNLPVGIEAFSSVASFANIGPIAPIAPGEFRFSISVPPNPALRYFEMFHQCAVLDADAPGFLGLTQAGKTVIYP